MKLTQIHLDKRLASSLTCVILLLASLLFFTNVIAAPPPDEPDRGEVRLSEKDNGRQIELREDQILVISLTSNPSTGYMWEVVETKQESEKILRQEGKSEFESAPGLLGARPLLGAPVKQTLRFEAAKAGQTELKLIYRRAWENVAPAQTFAVQVQAAQPSKPVGTSPATPTIVPSSEKSISITDQTLLSLPSSYNWCDSGGCTPVKDQGNCGSCWTFGTIGPLESNIKIKDGLTKDLSEQYLLSCNTDSWGCNGGWWAHDYHLNKPSATDAGAVYEAAYPYTAREDACNLSHTHYEKITSWAYVGSEYGIPSVAAIRQAIYDYGPVAVAVCAGSAFGYYSGGIFQTDESASCGGGIVNHAVVLVGWDDSQGTWRLRNSWGTGWGESGYMNIKYGTSNVGFSANYVVYEGGGCPDVYESDNDHPNAKSIIVNGATQTHNFHAANDVDWAKFTVTGGGAYTITTSNLGASNDTILALYDTDGTTMLASNDDCPGNGKASCINNWIAPLTSTYFITVSNVLSESGCAGYGYDLTIVGDSKNNAEIYLPLIIKSSACNDTQVVQNGGFESGRTIWTQSSGSYYIIGSGGDYFPYSGSWTAWFGGYDNADDKLYQTINIPTGVSSARLTFYLYVDSVDSSNYPYDYFHAELQNASGGTLQSFLWADNRMDQDGWWVGTMEWSDFSAHAGQTRRLFFQGTNDFSLYTNFFVDNVTFWTYCGGLTEPGKDPGPDGWTWQKVEAPPGYILDKVTGPKEQ